MISMIYQWYQYPTSLHDSYPILSSSLAFPLDKKHLEAASVVEKLKGLECQAAPGCLVWQCPGCHWATLRCGVGWTWVPRFWCDSCGRPSRCSIYQASYLGVKRDLQRPTINIFPKILSSDIPHVQTHPLMRWLHISKTLDLLKKRRPLEKNTTRRCLKPG